MLNFADDVYRMTLDIDQWTGLKMRGRKPYSDKISGTLRNGVYVNFHTLHPCHEWEANVHPHKCVSEFFVLSGRYKESIYYGENPWAEDADPTPVVENVFTIGSWHKIANPLTWHKVHPTEITYSLVIEKNCYASPLPEANYVDKTTVKISKEQMIERLKKFRMLLSGNFILSQNQLKFD